VQVVMLLALLASTNGAVADEHAALDRAQKLAWRSAAARSFTEPL
jgi:hypothetical protein